MFSEASETLTFELECEITETEKELKGSRILCVEAQKCVGIV